MGEYWGDFMKKMIYQDSYKLAVIILLMFVGLLLWILSDMVYKVNNTIYFTSTNSIKLFGYMMEDYNEKIMDAETTTEKYETIKKMLPRLDRLSIIMDNSRFNKELSSKIEPFLDYLAGLDDSSLVNDAEYLDDTIMKINKVSLISKKIAAISADAMFANDFSSNYYYKFKFNFNHNFKLSPEVLTYFDEINSIILED